MATVAVLLVNSVVTMVRTARHRASNHTGMSTRWRNEWPISADKPDACKQNNSAIANLYI